MLLQSLSFTNVYSLMAVKRGVYQTEYAATKKCCLCHCVWCHLETPRALAAPNLLPKCNFALELRSVLCFFRVVLSLDGLN